MAAEKLDTSVFTDDSGSRTRIVAIAMRMAVGLLGLAAATVAVSVFGHVTLPGLDQPFRVPGLHSNHPNGHHWTIRDSSGGGVQSPSPAASQGSTSSGTLTTIPTAKDSSGAGVRLPSPAASPGSTPPGSGQPTATTATTTPTAKATGKPAVKRAKPTVAATPTHRPTAPPGKPTSSQPIP